MINKKSKGSILFFSIIITAVVLTIGLGLTNLLIKQFKIIKESGNSVLAFYAADSGAEFGLFELFKENIYDSGPIPTTTTYFLDSNLGYKLVIDNTSACSASYYCIRSYGFFQQYQRRIELAY